MDPVWLAEGGWQFSHAFDRSRVCSACGSVGPASSYRRLGLAGGRSEAAAVCEPCVALGRPAGAESASTWCARELARVRAVLAVDPSLCTLGLAAGGDLVQCGDPVLAGCIYDRAADLETRGRVYDHT